MADYDLAIVGGGINGCGIARDAAGRGLEVLLVEQGDLGGATSSASTKLIHGGLRYLEHYDFRLVRKSLAERERLLGLAPHLVRPMRFILPHVSGQRPAWMQRAGFWLYDHLGGRTVLPKTRVLDLADDPAGRPLKSGFHVGFEYSDCVADNSRLVIANAIGAREKGAKIRPHTRLVAARREDEYWQIVLQAAGGRETVQRSRARQCCGPVGGATERNHSFVCPRASRSGSPRAATSSFRACTRMSAPICCRADDGRLVFAIPYQDRYTLIGTTDTDITGDPGRSHGERRRDSLSLPRRRAPISARRSSRRSWCGVSPACGRSSMTAPRTPMISRAITPSRSTGAMASRRSFPCSAASSPPIAASPRRYSRNSSIS